MFNDFGHRPRNLIPGNRIAARPLFELGPKTSPNPLIVGCGPTAISFKKTLLGPPKPRAGRKLIGRARTLNLPPGVFDSSLVGVDHREEILSGSVRDLGSSRGKRNHAGEGVTCEATVTLTQESLSLFVTFQTKFADKNL